MRRRLAYILLTAALIVGGAATIGSCITNLDTDVTYGAGRDLYFKVLKKDSTDNKVTGVSPDAYYGNNDTGSDTGLIDAVAEEFEYRLENWGANATVTKQGTDTLVVSVRGQGDDDTEYNYLANYLPFSGGHISLGVGCGDEDTEANAPHYDEYNTMFDGHEADIRYVNNVPVVTIEVNEPGKEGKLAELINYCNDNTQSANEEEGVEAKNCYVVLWSNRQDADTFVAATNTSAEDYDVNMSKRLVFGEDPKQAWYDDADDDNDYKRFQIIPNSTAIKDDKFDESKAGAAYLAAVYYKSILNASDYAKVGSGCEVSYAFSHTITASVEELAAAGDWHLTPAFNLTMIATLVSLLAAVILVGVFYRMGALAVIANASFTVIGTLLLFGYFSAQFGVGALVGLALATIISAFGGVYHFAKMKEELYKGRTLKKAYSEAIKKTLWPTIDAGLISIFSGLCIYGLIPGAFSKMGLMLVLGGFFGLVANLILLRIESWLLANDKNTDTKIASFYGVETSKVPNLANGEKQTFFGPLYEKDYTKTKKPMAIVAAVLAVASIAGVSVFSALNGNAYNYSNTYADKTAISIEFRAENGLSSASLRLATVQQVKDDFFSVILNGEKSLNDYVDDIILEKSAIHMTDEERTYDVYYFNVTLNQHFSTGSDAEEIFTVNVGGDTNKYSLQSALKEAKDAVFGSEPIYVQAQNVVTSVGTPSLGTVYVATAVSLLALIVYFALRFKPSRAVATTLIAAGSGVTVAGFFALTRIAVTPVASIGVLTTTVVAFLLSLFIFNKEKEVAADSHEKDKSSREFGLACLKEASKQSAGDMLVMSLIICFIAILYYGIGPSAFSSAFLGMAIGLVVLVAFLVTLLVPAVEILSKWFMLLKNSLKRTKKETKAKENIGRRRGAEPEEAIIIGIND